MGGRGLLAVCRFLGALVRLGRVLVQLRMCLTLRLRNFHKRIPGLFFTALKHYSIVYLELHKRSRKKSPE
jgi:hypothetical protein